MFNKTNFEKEHLTHKPAFDNNNNLSYFTDLLPVAAKISSCSNRQGIRILKLQFLIELRVF